MIYHTINKSVAAGCKQSIAAHRPDAPKQPQYVRTTCQCLPCFCSQAVLVWVGSVLHQRCSGDGYASKLFRKIFKMTHKWYEPVSSQVLKDKLNSAGDTALFLILSLSDTGSGPARLCYHSATWALGGWQPNFGPPSAGLGGVGGSGQKPEDCSNRYVWPGQRSAGTALQLGSGEWKSYVCEP